MRVWMISLDEDCDWMTPEKPWSVDYKRSFCGESKFEGWVSEQMVPLEKECAVGQSDFYRLSGVSGFAADQKAFAALFSILSRSAEFLPLFYQEREVFLVNVTRIIDCLDLEKSNAVYFDGTRKVMHVKEYCFNAETLRDATIFRIKEIPYQGPFVTEKFINVYEAADLHGLKFELVWVSDDDGESCARRESIAEISLPQDRWFPYAGPVEMSAIEEIRSNSEEVQRLLGVSLEDDAPSCVNAIEEKVQELLDGSKGVLEEKELICESIKLGSLFGEALCKAYGWCWKKVGQDEEGSAYAVCSPQDLYCVFPFQVIQLILEGGNIGPDGTNDNTAMLLFNMLESIERSVPEKTLTPLG